MATSTEPREAEQFVEFDEFIDIQIEKTQANVKWTDVMTAGVVIATAVVTYLLLFVVLDHWVIEGGFSRGVRGLMLGGLALVAGGWVYWKVAVPYMKRVNGLYAARVLEQADPALKSSLLNLVDLERSGKEIPEAIKSAMEKRAAVRLSHLDIEHVVDHGTLMRVSYALLAVVILACAYTVLSPKRVSNSIWRALFPAADVSVATRTEISRVDPGDTSVLARAQLEVSVDLLGDIPEKVTLLYTTLDRKYVDEAVEMQPTTEGIHRYRAMLTGENGRGLLQDLTYHIVAGDARSADYHVTVARAPSAEVGEIKYEYPAYMQLGPQSQTTGNVDAWEGTKVTLTAQANMPVKSAVVTFSDTEQPTSTGEEVRMEIAGGTALRAEWTLALREDGSSPKFYRIVCRNDQGQTDPNPTVYTHRVRPDLPPEVALIDPVRDLEMPANGVVPLLIEARDPDFRLSSLRLKLEKNEEELAGAADLIYEGNDRAVRDTHEFHLDKLRLTPGTVLTYYIQAQDNREPLANRKNTPKLSITIRDPASPEEVQKKLEEIKEEQKKILEESAEKANEEGTPEQKQEATDPQGEEGAEGSQPGGEAQSKPGEGEQGTKPEPGDNKDPNGDSQGEPGNDPSGQPGEQGTGENKQPGESSENGENEQPGGGSQPGAQARREENQPPGEQPDPDNPADDSAALDKILKHQQDPNGEDKEAGAGAEDDAKPGERPRDNSAHKDDGGDQSPEGTGQKSNEGSDTGAKPDDPKQNGDETGKEGDKPKDSALPKGMNKNNPKPGKEGEEGNAEAGASDEGKPDEATEPGKQPGGVEQPSNQEGASKEVKQDGGAKPNKPGDAPGANQTDKPIQGEETPAEESPNATREKATGNETGTGTPEDDPKNEATPAKNDIQRKPGTTPKKKRGAGDPGGKPKAGENQSDNKPSGESSSSDPKNASGDPKDPNNAANKSSSDPKNSRNNSNSPKGKPKPGDPKAGDPKATEENTEGGTPTDKPATDENPSGAKPDATNAPDERDLKPEGGAPKGGDAPKGTAADPSQPGEPGAADPNATPDQEQSPSGEQGEGTPSGSESPKNSPSEGGQSDQPNAPEQPPQNRRQGEAEKPTDGGQGDQSQNSSGGESSQTPDDAAGSGSKSEGGNPGGGGEKPGDTPGGAPGAGDSAKAGPPTGNLSGQEGPGDGNQGGGEGGSGTPTAPKADAANLEFSKKAVDLALKRLEGQLDRGDVDADLLKELGWTDEDLRRFVNRMSKELRTNDHKETPQSLARKRQFEEMLKSLNLGKKDARRKGSTTPKSDGTVFGGSRVPVPAEYREDAENYSRGLGTRAKPRTGK